MALLFFNAGLGPLLILSKNKEYKLHFPLVKCLEISSKFMFVYNFVIKPVWYTYCVKFTTALVNVFLCVKGQNKLEGRQNMATCLL